MVLALNNLRKCYVIKQPPRHQNKNRSVTLNIRLVDYLSVAILCERLPKNICLIWLCLETNEYASCVLFVYSFFPFIFPLNIKNK